MDELELIEQKIHELKKELDQLLKGEMGINRSFLRNLVE
ncbi:hypothetical protein THOE12_110077 [Vibrio rotiferianus]|nr:hypothetical protein THOE12_110077 [Vibrio rotiferianus]